MNNELFLSFRVGDRIITVERKEEGVTFEARNNDGEPVSINVEESIQCKMYKFDINKDKCIVAFDNDDICLHVKKENGVDYIYYSLQEDDTTMYSIEEIKEMYEEKCVARIQNIKDKFCELIDDVKTMCPFYKYTRLNRVKQEFYKQVNSWLSLYMIDLHQAEYIHDVRECNNNTISKVIELEKEYVNKLREQLL